MREWWSLFKNELTKGKRTGVFALLLILIIGGAELYLAYRFRSGVVSMLCIVNVAFLIIVPAVNMLLSLRREREMKPLWLQLPLPGWKLLTTKYAAVMVDQFVSILIAIGLFFWVYQVEKSGTKLISGFAYLKEILVMLDGKGIFIVLMFLYSSLVLAIWIVFLYFIAASLKNRLGGWRWPVAILLFAVVIALEGWFKSSVVFQSMFEWGQINWSHMNTGVLTNAETSNFIESNPFYIGDVLWECCVTAGALYLSVWLLDRKVEV